MELRGYQSDAIGSLWQYIQEHADNPCVVLPTGGGKGVLLAQIAKDVIGWGGRLAILAHVRELLVQTADNIKELAPEVPLGIYSAGLGSRDIGYSVTVAGIQSVYDRADEFGKLDLIAIDEAHRIPSDGEGMYRTFIQKACELNPSLRIIGLTATPYRTSSGTICKPENLLNQVCYEISVKELISQGYLSPLTTKAGKEKADLTSVRVRAGEYAQDDLEAAVMKDEQKVILACLEIGERTQDRSSILIFCVGIAHAKLVAQAFSDMGIGDVKTIFGDTPDDERDRIILDFRAKRIKYLVNVNVLTTGFDAPGIDCVAVLRPTLSPGLWYQMVGRGFRKAEGKKDCLILDFGGNAKRHGPVDRIIPPKNGKEPAKEDGNWKECPACGEIVMRGCEVCPSCELVFEKKKLGFNHSHEADSIDVLSREDYEVLRVSYWKHKRKGMPDTHPSTLWVEYDCGIVKASEWVCFEHGGFAFQKAVSWWRTRSAEPVPGDVQAALISIALKGIQEPKKISIQADGKYMRVKRVWEFQYKPPEPAAKDKEEGPYGESDDSIHF